MREMKDSGIDYIGEIPINMTVVRLKNIVGISDGTHDTPQYVDAGNNTYPLVTSKHINSGKIEIDKAFHISENDYKEIIKRSRVSMYDVIMPMIGTIGNPALVVTSEPFAIKNVALLKCSGSYYLGRYVVYLLNSYVAQTQFELVVQSGVQSFISQEKLKNLYFPFTANYKQIVDFLDSKCTELDSITSDIQSQIETLEEYKRSVITEAVTKGLDPDVEMRDSGVQWVGEMPTHWKLNKGKYILKYLQKPVRENDGVITCFRDGEVTLRSNRREDGFTMADKEIGYQGIDVGDLVVHGMDGFAGAIGISDSRGKASPVLNVLNTDQNKQYIMYYLRSMAYNDVFLALATGIRVRSCDLRWNKLAELLYPLPPIEEQQAIVQHIDSVLERTNAIITDKKQQIETIEEYKKSLIFEYVTGKKEV